MLKIRTEIVKRSVDITIQYYSVFTSNLISFLITRIIHIFNRKTIAYIYLFLHIKRIDIAQLQLNHPVGHWGGQVQHFSSFRCALRYHVFVEA